ncbi:LutC/YkgG family protein [Paludifilum halophilum]|uniref:Lactate utilization protein C n=1 Tax=Paludifilum halophilum TaxID=1642702 RepID=A0A235B5B1_9BACL|nr:lactate utilization protein C [Paludifilum halophilum]OYD07149.1 lactate utilization protein C [Paludifilum halophilum]
MSIHNRDSFLDQVAEKLGRERRRTGVMRPRWRHTPQWKVFEGDDRDDLSDRLKEQCGRIHTQLKRSTAERLPRVMDETIRTFGRSVVIGDDPRFQEYGLDEYFQQSREKGELDVHVWDPARDEENIRFAEKADVGITFSDITLAESGTVVLFSDNGKGRSISLLPRTYIAILPKSTIVPRMSQATREIHQRVERGEAIPSCINFISGPSNSADIEMNLIVGVHGPVQAAYILVEDR